MSINKTTLDGHVGQEPEFRKTSSGTSILTFSLATNDGWGENKKTNWHNIKVWSKLADLVSPMIHKGSSVTVLGELEYEHWEAKDGTKRSRAIVTAKEVEVHGQQMAQREPEQQREAPQPQQQTLNTDIPSRKSIW